MDANGPTIIDLNGESAKLTMFYGRTPRTTFAERRGSAALLGRYRNGFLLLSKSAGKSHWEAHPEDELLHVLEGSMIVDILEHGGPRSFAANAGMMVVVPQGAWHRVQSADGMNVFSATILDIVCGEGAPQSLALNAGTIAVIPQGAWHRFRSSEGFTQLALTPFPGEVIERDVDDPRGSEARAI